MKKAFITFLAATALAAFAANTCAGTIVGTVRAEGKTDGKTGGGGGKYDSRKFKFVERIDYDELRDFVVYIDGKLTNAPARKPGRVQIVTQKDAMFRPHVLPVLAGTTVEWPNRDEIYHNVFSMSESNPFDLGLYKGDKEVPFKNPGRVDVFCSIHTKMSCVLLVLENPFFASADASGDYRIEDVPAGTYQLKAWHERMPAQAKEIVVPEQGEVRVDFVLGIKNLPQY